MFIIFNENLIGNRSLCDSINIFLDRVVGVAENGSCISMLTNKQFQAQTTKV